MTKVLFIDPEKCTGCMACVLACSLQHGDTSGPVGSMILPIKLRRQAINIPVVCRQCTRPLCADACPMGAISRDDVTRAMRVDPDLCIGCGMCMIACPLGGISVNAEVGRAVKCDLCAGDPLCVKFCGYGALTYLPEEEATYERKKEAIGKLSDLLETLAT
jgi:carbon-monoxide dehydrogenase iron sulfur subunit